MIDPLHPQVTSDLAAGAISSGDTESIHQEVIDDLITLLKQEPVRKLVHEYEHDRVRRDPDMGFNPFALVSDLYYRENLHSDILKAILDPRTTHKCEGIFLDKFLTFLIEAHRATIDKNDYRNAQVVREENRIDIFIKGDTKGHAIIIENKMYNAPDMHRQLPRYVEYAKDYTIDAVVYLRLHGNTFPDLAGWEPSEIKAIKEKLLCIAASDLDGGKTNLSTGWLLECEDAAQQNMDPEAYYLLKHYHALITKLAANAMNKEIMEKFYDIMGEHNWENLKTAQSIKAMLDGLVGYRIDNIVDRFGKEPRPFTKIYNYNGQCAAFTGCLWQKAHFCIDVWVDPGNYRVQFFDRNDSTGSKGCARSALERMKCLDQYKQNGNRVVTVFEFPRQEKELLQHIEDFK